MKSLIAVVTLCLVACSSSSSDPAPSDDDGGGDASIEAGACLSAGTTCGDTVSTPCCSSECAIGQFGDFTCN